MSQNISVSLCDWSSERQADVVTVKCHIVFVLHQQLCLSRLFTVLSPFRVFLENILYQSYSMCSFSRILK